MKYKLRKNKNLILYIFFIFNNLKAAELEKLTFIECSPKYDNIHYESEVSKITEDFSIIDHLLHPVTNEAKDDPKLEEAGSIIAYFLKKDGTDVTRKYGSGMLAQNDLFITAAHVLTIKSTDDKDLQVYFPYAFKVLFISNSGVIGLCRYYTIHPKYLESSYPTMNDIAVCLCEKKKPLSQNKFFFKEDFYSIKDNTLSLQGFIVTETTANTINRRLIKVKDHFSAKEITYSEGHHENGIAVLFHHLSTYGGISGGVLFERYSQKNYGLTAVHVSGSLKNSDNSLGEGFRNQWEIFKGKVKGLALILSSLKQQHIRQDYFLFQKHMIWQTLSFDYVNPAIDTYRPVLFVIQTDDDWRLQEKFLTLLKEKIDTTSDSLSSAMASSMDDGSTKSASFMDYVDLWALNSKAKTLISNNFDSLNDKKVTELIDTSSNQKGLFPKLNDDQIEEVLRRFKRMSPKKTKLLIFSLGVGSDTKEVHQKLIGLTESLEGESKSECDYYHRINYLKFPGESEDTYTSRIDQEAAYVCDILKQNFNFKP